MNMPDQLPDEMLARRGQLPVKPAAIKLEGRYVRLEPYDMARHLEPLYAISNGSAFSFGDQVIPSYDPDETIWRWMFAGPFLTLDDFAAYMGLQMDAANGLPYTVIQRQSGRPVGVANYMNNAPEHLKIELGSIWYSPVAQRTFANTEATYLMLRHAFDLGYRRVEWKCNALNERSRRSAERMGFTFEGIQEAHFIIKNRNRDTAWFRILADEWPEVRAKLENMLRD